MAQDYVSAYMWFTLAVELGAKDASMGRKFLEGRMTRDQTDEAGRMAQKWLDQRRQ